MNRVRRCWAEMMTVVMVAVFVEWCRMACIEIHRKTMARVGYPDTGVHKEAANDYVYPEERKMLGDPVHRMREEAVQVIVTAVRFLEELDGMD